MRVIRIAAGSGGSEWDDLTRATKEILGAGVDYLCYEQLAEIVLAWMATAKEANPDKGFSGAMAEIARLTLPSIRDGKLKVITNGGGANPQGARKAVAQVARDGGFTGIRCGVVDGADLKARLPQLMKDGHKLANIDTGENLDMTDDVIFAVAYLGAYPIVEALKQGAQFVITGRVADPSLYMAPAIYEYGVAPDDWERLGRLAALGHLTECSTQVSGGKFGGRWWEVPNLANVGMPIAEAEPDGTCVITKAPGTGGLVSFDTVKEQLLYEVNDPNRYFTPDVIAQFDKVHLHDAGPDRVRVSGGGGYPASPTYKVIIGRKNGWAAWVYLVCTYPNALAKAKAAAKMLDERLPGFGVTVLERSVEYLGAGGVFGEVQEGKHDEVILRYGVRVATEAEAKRVTEAHVPLFGLSGPPGVCSMHGSSAVAPRIKIWPALIPREVVDPGVSVQVEELR